MMRLNWMTRTGLLAGMGSLLMLFGAGGAQAYPSDPYFAYHGADEAWSDIGYQPPPGATHAEHRFVGVIDKEYDGNKVQVDFVLRGGTTHFHYYDNTGCSDGGNGATQSTAVYSFRVCELFDSGRWGCSDWVYPRDVIYT